jgi:hypothetical protein
MYSFMTKLYVQFHEEIIYTEKPLTQKLTSGSRDLTSSVKRGLQLLISDFIGSVSFRNLFCA